MLVVGEDSAEMVDVAGGEHTVGQLGAPGDQVVDLAGSAGGGGDPHDDRVDAARNLFAAVFVVAQVGVGFSEEAFGMFCSLVDLQPPVILVPVERGGQGEVGFDPFDLAMRPEVASPAEGFSLDVD